ncbi:uncharacterized protein LOC123193031 isoform X2 [Mangifera indica]|uniref:uncharacterized protein LOC123193031 isoform X2 n=1 Tax=Mangifera indica TaxID=29780 RepID=UPI001CFA15C8|nr:uncharacterized protein LOC123193031 isoform X2 [Mangifera indica]
MAGNVRFESSSATPEDLASSGSYPNGQRGIYSLDRSGSFREGCESRMFNSATSMSRGMATSTVDVPSLSQWLSLDPITIGDPKYTRLGELVRKVLGISLETTAEDNAFGASHAKPTPAVATEELKRFKANVLDGSLKAQSRAKKIHESLLNLDKYVEALNPKKLPRSEILTNERPGGTNMLKMGALMQRNSPDLLPQRLEDRTKSTDRSNIPMRQPLVLTKDRDVLKDGGETSDVVEEKIRRLPAGEGWEKKMKRKRSVGNVFTRPVSGDGELRRVMHHKLNSESGLSSCDAQGFRPGSSGGANGINKLDNTSLSASSNVRVIPKSDLEKVSLSRDFMPGLNKERIKGNKLNIREDNLLVSNGLLTKVKASRPPRTGPVMAPKSSPNIPRPFIADGWEQPPNMNKINSVGGASNRKRPLSAGSSSPPITQWGGQRPQKTSRSRRANLVSPVSNLDESQTSSEGCTPADLGARMPTIASNRLLIARGMSNGTPQYKVKQEMVSSPARLSESEESGAGENRVGRLKERGVGSGEVEERTTSVHSGGPSLLLTKKNKALNNEEIGDGVRRQGRSGRSSSYSRSNISPLREKLENSSSSKLLKSSRPGSDKNGSKSGRPPLKKVSEHKLFTRLGHTSVAVSPDLSGDSDDDREDLLAAANFACNSSYLACSGSFWKKMEPMFASISLEDVSYLKQQDSLVDENFLSRILVSGEKDRSLKSQIQSKELTRIPELGDQVQDDGFFCGTMDTEIRNEDTPLYQRVLSALIVVDEIEEFSENIGGRNLSFQYNLDDSPGLLVDADSRKMDRMEIEYDSMLGLQVQKQSSFERLTCNGTTTFNRGKNIQNRMYNDDLANGGTGLMHSEIGILTEFSENGSNGPQALHTSASGVDSIDCQYDDMPLRDKLLLEVQSIGLHLEAVPDLADGEEETIIQDIVKLQKGLRQQMVKKKEHLNKILKAVEKVKETEERGLEQVAMDRLVELAYKKKLVTRGSSASKSGVTKVSKQVASAFMKRVLARCHKFEETGKSCFAESSLRDVIFATPRNVLPETFNCQPVPSVSGSFNGNKVEGSSFDSFETHVHSMDQDFVKTGPIFNRGRKKEVLLDDVGGSASLRAASAPGNTLSGGAKGKRSERERDKDTSVKNSVAKSGRALTSNFKGERKMKSKPKQKTAQLSTSGNGFVDKFIEPGHSVYSASNVFKEGANGGENKKREFGFISHDNVTQNSSEVKEPFDLIEELGGVNDLNDHQDLSTLFNNLSADDLQDQDLMGLQIPMDDLSELALF